MRFRPSHPISIGCSCCRYCSLFTVHYSSLLLFRIVPLSNRIEGLSFSEQPSLSLNCYSRTTIFFSFNKLPELEVLKQLYGLLSPYVNFFLPSQKLQEKIRQGSRVTKRYDRAQTPDRRLLDSTQLSKQAKAELRRRFRRLNPAQLHREIVRLQEKLVALQTRKRRGVEGAGSDGKAQGGFPTAPWKTPRKEFPPPAARTSF